MRRAAALFLFCIGFAVSQTQAASYGCHVRVVGGVTIEKAIRQLSSYINTSGSHVLNTDSRAAALFCRGQLYDLSGKPDIAASDFSESIKWNSHEAGVYYARGDVYEDLGQADKAELDYAEGGKVGGTVPAKRASLCWQRAVRGRPLDRALADCNAAVASEPDNMPWRNIRGFLYYKMSRYPDALADLDVIVKANARDTAALFIRGIVKRRMGDVAGGDGDIDAATRIDFHVADFYAVYGITP